MSELPFRVAAFLLFFVGLAPATEGMSLPSFIEARYHHQGPKQSAFNPPGRSTAAALTQPIPGLISPSLRWIGAWQDWHLLA